LVFQIVESKTIRHGRLHTPNARKNYDVVDSAATRISSLNFFVKLVTFITFNVYMYTWGKWWIRPYHWALHTRKTLIYISREHFCLYFNLSFFKTNSNVFALRKIKIWPLKHVVYFKRCVFSVFRITDFKRHQIILCFHMMVNVKHVLFFELCVFFLLKKVVFCQWTYFYVEVVFHWSFTCITFRVQIVSSLYVFPFSQYLYYA